MNKMEQDFKIPENTLKILKLGYDEVNDMKYLYMNNFVYFNIYVLMSLIE